MIYTNAGACFCFCGLFSAQRSTLKKFDEGNFFGGVLAIFLGERGGGQVGACGGAHQ